MTRKCVFVIGPESTGSKLIARVISHVLDIKPYGEWDGSGWCDNGVDKVCHRSLPYGNPAAFPDVAAWVAKNESLYKLYFVLTTRDITISEQSRIERFAKPREQVREESEQARSIVIDVLESEHPSLVWSYETLIFLGKSYLDLLYDFLEVSSDFSPLLEDGNKKRISM